MQIVDASRIPTSPSRTNVERTGEPSVFGTTLSSLLWTPAGDICEGFGFIYFSEPSEVCFFILALLDDFRDLSDWFGELAWMPLEAEIVQKNNCPGAPRGGQLVFGRFQRFAGIFRRLRGHLARTLLRDKTYQPRSTPYSELPKVPRGGE